MCLIIACPKGTDKNTPFLLKAIEKGYRSNSDGAGYAFKRADNSILLQKGFFEVNSENLIKSINEHNLAKDDELIIHFRISTSGEKDQANCHPFIIPKKQNDFNISNCNGILAHNGIFSDHTDQTSKFSDTYHFVNNFLSIPQVFSILAEDKVVFNNIFKSVLGSNRLAILMRDQPMITIGNFITDEGYMFSNIGYKDVDYRNVGGRDNYTQNSFHDNYNNYNDYYYEDLSAHTEIPYIKIHKYNYQELILSCCKSTSEYGYRDKFKVRMNDFLLPGLSNFTNYATLETNSVNDPVRIIHSDKIKEHFNIHYIKNNVKYVDYLHLCKQNTIVNKSVIKQYRKLLKETKLDDFFIRHESRLISVLAMLDYLITHDFINNVKEYYDIYELRNQRNQKFLTIGKNNKERKQSCCELVLFD